MKTQRILTVAAVVAILSYGVGAFLSLPASNAATPPVTTTHRAAPQSNALIQQALQHELQQRMHLAHTLNVERIHHEFALKDAEIRHMHTVIAHKDAIIKQLRGMLGIPSTD